MKNKIILIICLLLIVGCTSDKKEKQEKEVDSKEIITNITEPTIKENSIEIGLYQNINGTRTLIETFDSTYPSLKDIASFEVYYTKEEKLEHKSQKDLWNYYTSQNENIGNNKIGYTINFKTDEEEINKTILTPKDVESFFNYIQIYLYDDIHQNSSWYDHIEESEVNDETIFTSIKLTGSIYIDKITSPITLTVFTYNKELLNEENEYIGNNKYKITINKK